MAKINEHLHGDCRPIAHILARVGDKWTVLVVGKLGKGRMRFSELRAAVDIITRRRTEFYASNLALGSKAKKAEANRTKFRRLIDRDLTLHDPPSAFRQPNVKQYASAPAPRKTKRIRALMRVSSRGGSRRRSAGGGR